MSDLLRLEQGVIRNDGKILRRWGSGGGSELGSLSELVETVSVSAAFWWLETTGEIGLGADVAFGSSS